MTLPDWVLIEAAKRFGWDRGRPLSALQKDYGVSTPFRAFCDMILKHEAFRQEVSDAVGLSIERCGHDGLRAGHINEYLGRFIITKPDPLEDALAEALARNGQDLAEHTERLRAALASRNLKIVSADHD